MSLIILERRVNEESEKIHFVWNMKGIRHVTMIHKTFHAYSFTMFIPMTLDLVHVIYRKLLTAPRITTKETTFEFMQEA